ncbi:reverse transcriptase domain-containing protein [Tanacetum coccineum]|uniref:Reverse transcriptase domain-containing protein n=1 Tax=Tanacetum coccineum TaxID=301880 RepID=A0ABQ5H769_9ASTR
MEETEMEEMEIEEMEMEETEMEEMEMEEIGNGGNGNGNGNGGEYGYNFRGFMPARECTYQDFLKCQPLNFNGTEGVIGLTRCALTFGVELPQLRTVGIEGRPMPMILKMETELWNLAVKGNDLTAYTRRFQELVLLCTRMVPSEEDKVDRFGGGLPDNIQGNGYARSAENKRRLENNTRDNREHQPVFKRQNVGGQNVARAYTARNNEKKGYDGSLPYCSKCKIHHAGPCTVRCGNCKRVGHMTKDCKVTVTPNTQRAPVGNQHGIVCYECGRPGHFRKDCPKLRNQNHGNKTGNKNGNKIENQTRGNKATARAYAIGGGGTNPDSNFVRYCFLLNKLLLCFMLFDSGADRSFVSSTFSALLDVAPSTLDTSMDKSKITRKQSKASKHGHENQKSTKSKPKEAKALANFHLQGPFLQFSEVIYNLKERKERQGPNVQSFQTSTVLTVEKRSGSVYLLILFALHQLDTFYNSLNSNDQDALDSAAGGNFLDKMPQEGLAIIESKSKVRYSRSRANDSRVSTDAPLSNSSLSNNSFDMQQIAASLEDKMTIKMNQMMNQMKALVVTPAPVKAVEEFVQQALQPRFNEFTPNQASSSSTLPSNTIPNPRNEARAITTRSGVSYEGPSIPMPPPFVNPDVVEETSTEHVPPPLTQKVQETNSQTTTKVNQEGIVNNPKTYELKLPYPERRNVEKRQEKDKVQLQKFWKMFKQLHFNISLADAMILMPKYTKMLKDLCANKEKLEELANTPLSENCSAVILKKLPEKLGDSCRFTIPCDFSKLKCQGLADLGASINLMPLSVFHRLGFTNLESTQMTLELANRQLCRPDGICKDVLVPVGKFTYPADFVIVDYVPDEQIPLILGRPFLRTARALIDVYR